MLTSELAPVPDTVSLPDYEEVREKCGIVGVYSPGGFAVRAAYFATEALQHRGQDAAGLSWMNESWMNESKGGSRSIETYKGLGKVTEVFLDGDRIMHHTLPEFATGQTRYGTSEASDPHAAAHPVPFNARGNDYTVSQNGQFLWDPLYELAEEYAIKPTGTDTQWFAEILGAAVEEQGHIEPAMHKVLPRMEGAFCLSILGPEGLYGAIDRHNVRPFVIGRYGASVMFASEVRALRGKGRFGEKRLEYEFDREGEAGTYIVVNEDGVREERWSGRSLSRCIFEYEYLSKPDNIIGGKLVRDFRYEAGERLAAMDDVEADLVIPVLGSGQFYAEGYSAASGIPYEDSVLVPAKDGETERTFIAETLEDQQDAVAEKFVIKNPELIAGKRLVVVDDSLVRGNTARKINQMLRDAGAEEVHFRSGADQYKDPCMYGVNVQTKDELLATDNTLEKMAEEIDADSLLFLPVSEAVEATGQPEDDLCRGCQVDGTYPPTREQEARVKRELVRAG